jgi:hypothetical protein
MKKRQSRFLFLILADSLPDDEQQPFFGEFHPQTLFFSFGEAARQILAAMNRETS